MGIPRYFPWLRQTYPMCFSRSLKEEDLPEIDYLCIDFNAIIHGFAKTTHPDLVSKEISLAVPFKEMLRGIMKHVLWLMETFRPRKGLFLSVDGVAPMAKITEQRSRRISKNSIVKEELKTVESRQPDLYEEIKDKVFPSGSISPGTPFMQKLDENLRIILAQLVASKLPFLKGKEYYYSSHHTPGEGEFKFLDFVKTKGLGASYMFYSNDADMLIIPFAAQSSRIYVLRKILYYKEAFVDVAKPVFEIFYPARMRHILSISCMVPESQVAYDYILLTFLMGNDFLPNLMNVEPSDMKFLLSTYASFVKEKKRPLVDARKRMPDPEALADYFEHLSPKLEEYWKVIGSRNYPAKSDAAQWFSETIYNSNTGIKYGQSLWEERYIESKFGDKETEFKAAIDYVEMYFWTADYYLNNTKNYQKAYGYEYIPTLTSIIKVIREKKYNPKLVKKPPLPIHEQLMMIIVPESRELLPGFNHYEEEEFKEYFPSISEIRVDRNNKKNYYEYTYHIKRPPLEMIRGYAKENVDPKIISKISVNEPSYLFRPAAKGKGKKIVVPKDLLGIISFDEVVYIDLEPVELKTDGYLLSAPPGHADEVGYFDSSIAIVRNITKITFDGRLINYKMQISKKQFEDIISFVLGKKHVLVINKIKSVIPMVGLEFEEAILVNLDEETALTYNKDVRASTELAWEEVRGRVDYALRKAERLGVGVQGSTILFYFSSSEREKPVHAFIHEIGFPERRRARFANVYTDHTSENLFFQTEGPRGWRKKLLTFPRYVNVLRWYRRNAADFAHNTLRRMNADLVAPWKIAKDLGVSTGMVFWILGKTKMGRDPVGYFLLHHGRFFRKYRAVYKYNRNGKTIPLVPRMVEGYIKEFLKRFPKIPRGLESSQYEDLEVNESLRKEIVEFFEETRPKIAGDSEFDSGISLTGFAIASIESFIMRSNLARDRRVKLIEPDLRFLRPAYTKEIRVVPKLTDVALFDLMVVVAQDTPFSMQIGMVVGVSFVTNKISLLMFDNNELFGEKVNRLKTHRYASFFPEQLFNYTMCCSWHRSRSNIIEDWMNFNVSFLTRPARPRSRRSKDDGARSGSSDRTSRENRRTSSDRAGSSSQSRSASSKGKDVRGSSTSTLESVRDTDVTENVEEASTTDKGGSQDGSPSPAGEVQLAMPKTRKQRESADTKEPRSKDEKKASKPRTSGFVYVEKRLSGDRGGSRVPKRKERRSAEVPRRGAIGSGKPKRSTGKPERKSIESKKAKRTADKPERKSIEPKKAKYSADKPEPKKAKRSTDKPEPKKAKRSTETPRQSGSESTSFVYEEKPLLKRPSGKVNEQADPSGKRDSEKPGSVRTTEEIPTAVDVKKSKEAVVSTKKHENSQKDTKKLEMIRIKMQNLDI